MMALAEPVGRVTSHDLVYEAVMKAYESDQSFEDFLLENDRVAEALFPEEQAVLTDPTRYTDVSDEIARRTADASRNR